MAGDLIQNIDPLCCKIGPLGFRYYSILFFSALVVGYLLWRWQVRRSGRPAAFARSFFPVGLVALIVGARLGHCFFYEPSYYFHNPLEILFFWRGGLSSHGAALALALWLILFARQKGMPVMDALDRFSFCAAAGSSLVRLGNFFNSEIVGRPTDVPWGMRFIRFDGGGEARHPAQLYEMLIGIVVFVALVLIDRAAGREKRARGLLAGVFLAGYFSLRFIVEFFKEYQTLKSTSPLTMGQYLSAPVIVVGVAILVRVAVGLNQRKD